MVELEVPIPAGADLADIEQSVERTCAAAGLRSRLKSTLASFPGSVHWHFARPRERGTLEITWAPAPRRLWLKVSAARSAPWIAGQLPQLQQSLATALQTARSASNAL